MYGNNNGEAPVMAPGTENKINNALATMSHIPLPQWKAAVDARHQNGEEKWKSKFEDSEKRRKSLLTQSQKRKYGCLRVLQVPSTQFCIN
jgi:hypothetical protein